MMSHVTNRYFVLIPKHASYPDRWMRMSISSCSDAPQGCLQCEENARHPLWCLLGSTFLNEDDRWDEDMHLLLWCLRAEIGEMFSHPAGVIVRTSERLWTTDSKSDSYGEMLSRQAAREREAVDL